MSAITTHVLDAVLGKPAAGIAVRLDQYVLESWTMVAESVTDEDGRCRDLVFASSVATFRLTFAVGFYFERQGRKSIYPEIAITFAVDGERHYHIPLLLSDNSYTTYRGT